MNMTDPRQNYEKRNVIKVIIENPEGKVLLIQEPQHYEWMPGHWGLPGGKTLKKESLYNALVRKTKVELGMEVNPQGIYRIEELLMDERTVLMFIVIAKIDKTLDFKGESSGYKWVGTEEIQKMDISEFSEFYNKNLLLEYLSGNRETVDFDLIETQFYYDMDENPEYKKWWESGKKNVKSEG